MYSVKKRKQQPTPEEKTDTTTQAFLREVDDALHQEKMQELWQQWRFTIAIIVVGLFVIVGGSQWWKQSKLTTQQNAADAWYNIATAKNDEDKMLEINTLAEGKVLGAKIMAVFQKARQANESGDTLKAAKTYDLVAKDAAIPNSIRELAKFYSAMVLVSSYPADAESKLVTMDTMGHPYRASALEILAELAENRNDKVKALALWEKLREIPNVPSSIRTRATERAADMKTAANIK